MNARLLFFRSWIFALTDLLAEDPCAHMLPTWIGAALT
jgi:hypothetical protein